MLGDSVRRRQPGRRTERDSGEPRERGSWKRRLLTVAGVLLIPLALG